MAYLRCLSAPDLYFALPLLAMLVHCSHGLARSGESDFEVVPLKTWFMPTASHTPLSLSSQETHQEPKVSIYDPEERAGLLLPTAFHGGLGGLLGKKGGLAGGHAGAIGPLGLLHSQGSVLGLGFRSSAAETEDRSGFIQQPQYTNTPHYTPVNTYTPPTHTYAPTTHTYTLSMHTYAPPIHTYAPPLHTNAPPMHTNVPPMYSYAPPMNTNAPPMYAPSTNLYVPPINIYAPPTHSYAPPMHSYAPPMHSYAPPMHLYAPPMHSYAPPMHSYAPPMHSYAPPTHSYAPPTHSYAPPMHTNAPSMNMYAHPMYEQTPEYEQVHYGEEVRNEIQNGNSERESEEISQIFEEFEERKKGGGKPKGGKPKGGGKLPNVHIHLDA